MKKTKILAGIVLSLLMINLVSALTLNSVFADDLVPGGEGQILIEVKNTFDRDVSDVSLRLDFTNLPFTPIGSSEQSVSKIDEDEEEEFMFRIKAANNIAPGDYKIPFVLAFFDEEEKTRTGSVGVSVNSSADLDFMVSLDNPVIGEQGQITLRIVNKGFADAKFLSIRVIPEGFRLLSEDGVYVGTVDSDDFETATFDVVFNDKNHLFIAIVEYKDFNNKDVRREVNLPITVYTREEALNLGIIEKSNFPFYAGIVITLILIWVLYRTIRRYIRNSRRNKKER